MPIEFVEQKAPDIRRIEALLAKSARDNRWANRGPLYTDLSKALSTYTGLDANLVFVPLANGGVALEAMARLFSSRAGRRLRWVASAFSFRNIGRGYFYDTILQDCDADGLLDLDACSNLDPDSFDGLIITNPFGLHGDFSRFSDFAQRYGKQMLIDNASGLHASLPSWSWQAFSLHHTKPYGVGEGGAALVPLADAEDLYALVDYTSEQTGSPHWLGNGKISEVSCAFLLDRIERASDWVPRYLEQRQRLCSLAESSGFTLLSTPQDGLPMMSLPLLAPSPLEKDSIHSAKQMILGKYYKPLRNLPVLTSVYERLVNVPCHPDVSRLSNAQILNEFDRLLVTP